MNVIRASIVLLILLIVCSQALSLHQNRLLRAVKKSEKVELDDDNDDDYNDETDETENARQRGNKNINFVNRIGTTYAWDKWEKWSKCTNSCVQIRRRPCIKHIKNDTISEPLDVTFYPDTKDEQKGCLGVRRKYRLCKDEKCKSNKSNQLRDEQCEDFNKISFRGKFYNWRGYEKEHNECELFCRPIDSDIFVSMNQSVTDGTPCEKPAIYYTHAYRRRAVCVEGICRSNFSIQDLETWNNADKCLI